jgi:hypothetical protein
LGERKKFPEAATSIIVSQSINHLWTLFFVIFAWLLHMRTVLGLSGNLYGGIADD